MIRLSTVAACRSGKSVETKISDGANVDRHDERDMTSASKKTTMLRWSEDDKQGANKFIKPVRPWIRRIIRANPYADVLEDRTSRRACDGMPKPRGLSRSGSPSGIALAPSVPFRSHSVVLGIVRNRSELVRPSARRTIRVRGARSRPQNEGAMKERLRRVSFRLRAWQEVDRILLLSSRHSWRTPTSSKPNREGMAFPLFVGDVRNRWFIRRPKITVRITATRARPKMTYSPS